MVDFEDLLVLADNWLNNKYLSEADYDYSHFIDLEDLRLLAEQWLAPGGTNLEDFGVLANSWMEPVEINSNYDESVDLNSDEKVDFIDYTILVDCWLTGGQRYTHYYYHFDGLGNVVGLSDVAGDIVESYDYDYGQSNKTSEFGNPYLFTGRRLDEERGLYYYRARYYSSSLGRFLQPDPIGYDDGMNIYRYCKNNPINWADPLVVVQGYNKGWFR